MAITWRPSSVVMRLTFLAALLLCQTIPAAAVPKLKLTKRRPTTSNNSMKSVKSEAAPRMMSIRQRMKQQRGAILKFDAAVGVIYSSIFLLAPGKTLSTFFKYEFQDSIRPFLHLAVRMIGINHLGYVAGLLTAPKDKAIRTATAFMVVGGCIVVYYGQARLDVQWMFLSCTILTTLMILAHVLAL